jgi:hypothetical protein
MSKLAFYAFGALLILSLASAPPTYAVSSLAVSPSNVTTGGNVSITITHVAGALSDVFGFVTVTDPLGNVFTYNNHHIVVHSSVVLSFPDPTLWTLTSGPGSNAGTNVSGTYTVKGTYLDVSLSRILGRFVVLTNHGQFSVPEFGLSFVAVAAVLLPALLLVRGRGLKRGKPVTQR